MIFSDVLREVADRVEGCLGVVVMGMDGIPIEKLAQDDTVNFEMLATECTNLLRSTRQAAEDVGAGRLEEMIIMTDRIAVLAVTITEDYILLAALRQGANYGRARFLLKKASLRLEKEFV